MSSQTDDETILGTIEGRNPKRVEARITCDDFARPRALGYGASLRSRPSLRPVSAIDIFVFVSGSFSIVVAAPLIYLARGASRDARNLRVIQYELAALMRETKELGEEVRELQRDIRREQQAATSGIEETQRSVEQVTEAVEQVSSVVGHVNEAVQRVQEGGSGRSALLRRLVPLRAAGDD